MRAYIASRKGIFVTDRALQQLTPAQLYFEYLIESQAEYSAREFYIKAFRGTLITILGLDTRERSEAERSGVPYENENFTKFTPLVWLAGNHHLLHKYMDDMPSLMPEHKVNDSEFEEQAQRMMADADPIEGDPWAGLTPVEILERTVEKRVRSNLGILDKPPTNEFPLPKDSVTIDDG